MSRTLEQCEELIRLIEDFCESHRPFAEGKSEVVTRRILDAIRGRPEVLPPVTDLHAYHPRISERGNGR